RGCNLAIETARRQRRILSVAENFRRDPINRLIRALIDDGAIGTPRLMIETTIGGAAPRGYPALHQPLAGYETDPPDYAPPGGPPRRHPALLHGRDPHGLRRDTPARAGPPQ